MSEVVKPTPAKLTLTPRLIAQAQAMWESGEYASVRAISKKLNVAVEGLRRHLKVEDKGKSVGKVKEKTAEALIDAAAEEAALLRGRQKETKEEYYKLAQALTKLTWQEVLNAKTAGTALSVISGNLKALDIAMSVLKKAREERFAVLGMNDENTNDDGVLPELIVTELTEEEVKEIREAQEEDDFLALEAPVIEEAETGIVDTTDEDDEDA